MLSSFTRALAGAVALLGVSAGAAFAQTQAQAQAPANFPNKPIRLITLTTPGGSLDILARMIADEIGRQWGQQVIVENRVGAGGNIGAEATARSAPDGYTIGMVTVSTHGVNPTLYGERMRFDPVKDFAPIVLAAELKNVVVVHPSVPAKNVRELVAFAKANPDKISFGSAGTGTTQHLAGEMVKMIEGVQMQHVPYRGAAAAVPDLLSGQLQLMFVSIPDVARHRRDLEGALALAPRCGSHGRAGLARFRCARLVRRGCAGGHAEADRRSLQRDDQSDAGAPGRAREDVRHGP
jgi:tripartite-type tricarboxylate transporter receptor subunit TctC